MDDLKKQIQSLSTRVEHARANLAIQSKYRDAAISMARLYSPSKADGKRRSLLGNRMSDSAKEAEMEKLASERRCEELALELFSLEKRLMEPQRRLLQHTAGILQMTHRASSKKSGQVAVGPMINGIPSSPESLYTYTNARNSLEIPSDELGFEDKSMYLPLDQMDGSAARQRKNTIEIPMKSPIREQNAQLRELREELDRVKEENERILEENIQLKTAEQQLKDETARAQEEHARAKDEISRLQSREQELADENARIKDELSRIKDETSRFTDESSRLREAEARLVAIEQHMNAETEALRTQSAGQLKAMSDAEMKLEALNRKLRDVVVAFNPEKNGEFDNPEAAAGSGETLASQLDYMEKSLDVAVEEQKLHAAEAVATASSLGRAEASLEHANERVQVLARQAQLMLQKMNSDQSPPADGSLDEQLEYVENALQTAGSELQRAVEASASAASRKQEIEQVDAILMGLWEIIQTGCAEMEQQRAARRQNRTLGQDGGDDEDDLSSSEMDGYTSEPYSLQAFSTKVQWLYTQVTSLREQKYILQRQIKQQRELNNRSESEKDRELMAKTEELRQAHVLLDEAEQAARDAQDQLDRVLADMDTLQKTTAANEAASASSAKAVQEQLKERTARVASLEADVREAQSRLAAAEADKASAQSRLDEAASARAAAQAELAALQTQLASTAEAAAAAEASVAKLREELKAKDEELDRMNTMVIELKTEVAIAKAELDGAYGSRKQRAAEAAAAAAAQSAPSETEERLSNEVAQLRAELENTLRDLEDTAREAVAAEREKIDLEGRLDDALAVRADLEAELAALQDRFDREVGRLQDQLDAERLRVSSAASVASAAAGAGASRAGATMLSERFRATMKEERRRFQEELRVSCLFFVVSRAKWDRTDADGRSSCRRNKPGGADWRRSCARSGGATAPGAPRLPLLVPR